MNWHFFIDPIRTQYADFTGRTSRRPFWMFVLMYILINIALSIVQSILLPKDRSVLDIDDLLTNIYGLVLLVPSLAITARRLHDTNRSGWWQLLWFVPVIGWIVMIVFLVQESTPGDNRFGSSTGTVPAAAAVVPPTTPTPAQ